MALENGVTLRAASGRNPGFAAGERVTACLRPEVLEIVSPDEATAASGGGNALQGTLRLRNYLGWVMA